MHRVALPLLMAVLAASGCLGGAGEGAGASDSPAARPSSTRTSYGGSGTSSSEPNQPDAPRSNNTTTLHLLAAPRMSLVAPTGTTDTVVGVDSTFLFSAGVQWSYTAKARGIVDEANVTMWIRVTDVTPSWGGLFFCDFQVSMRVGPPGQGARFHNFDCPGGGIGGVPIVAPGTYEVVFTRYPNSFYSNEIKAGDTVTLQLNSYAISHPARSTVQVLTNSVAHDSRLQIRGWDEQNLVAS